MAEVIAFIAGAVSILGAEFAYLAWIQRRRYRWPGVPGKIRFW